MRIETNDFGFGEIIYAYTREQALEDGVLIDVSEMGEEAGFKIPVAVTESVWGMINNIPPACQGIQDVAGRLWDVLWMGTCAARRNPDKDTVRYKLKLTRIEQKNHAVEDKKTGEEIVKQEYLLVHDITLKMVIGPGDQGEPVLTIMMPNED